MKKIIFIAIFIFFGSYNYLYSYNVCTEYLDYPNDYDDDCIHQTKLDYNDDASRGFHNTMGDHGHTKKWLWANRYVWQTDYHENSRGNNECNTSSEWWLGDDKTYTDSCEFAWWSGHGGTFFIDEHYDDTHAFWKGALMVERENRGGDSCFIYSDRMRLGESLSNYYSYDGYWDGTYHYSLGNTKYLMLYTCHGLDLGYIEHWHKSNRCPNTPSSQYGVFQGLHMIFGFSGTHTDAWTLDEDGEDFADELHEDNIADAWLWGVSDLLFNHTIVVLSAGNSTYNSCYRLDNEWYYLENDPYPPTNFCWVYKYD